MGLTKCHMNFFAVLKSDFKAFQKFKKTCLRARLGFKRHFLFISFYSSNPFKKCFETCHIGGEVRKVPKMCHVFFEWPLTTNL